MSNSRQKPADDVSPQALRETWPFWTRGPQVPNIQIRFAPFSASIA